MADPSIRGGDDEQKDSGTPKKSGFTVPDMPSGDPEQDKEENLIKVHQKQYDTARRFDKNYRKQVAKDRRYADGSATANWAVSANIVCYVIEILTAILYARDPDVSVRKAPQVDDDAPANLDIETWARTLEVVISLLWKKAPLRNKLKQSVRSALTNSAGWIKLLALTEETPQPEIQAQLDDKMARKDQIKAQRELVGEAISEDDLDAEEAELDALIEADKGTLEKGKRQEFIVEFVPTQGVQLSLDVAREEDYVDCDWITFDLFVPRDSVLERFPRLEEDDIKSAREYYQKPEPNYAGAQLDNDSNSAGGNISAEEAEEYTTATKGDEEVVFVKVMEKWCRKDSHIYTWIEGVKKWAKEPFQPQFATSRFYPCFRLAFFDVDGKRHAQSIPSRIDKLQDEYACARSNFRLARERSIPSIIFNAQNISDEEANKLKSSVIQELIALKQLDPTQPIGNNFAEKPVSKIDPRVFDTTPILQDINRITGVQEALQGAASGPKTATEAQLEQMGMNARSTSDRDALEWMLSEAAQYTAEIAIQAYSTKDIQAMVGTAAIWPEGLGIHTMNRLVNIVIQAGSTGKPRKAADQQAWGVILPLLEKTIGNIVIARQQGNTALAKALEELVRETMLRMGDESDVERFIPPAGQQAPPPNGGMQKPQVSISLKGVVPPQDAAAIAAEALPPGAQPAPPQPGAAPPGAPPGQPGAGPPPGQEPGPQGAPPGAVPPVHAM
jgi:hypothetical protein